MLTYKQGKVSLYSPKFRPHSATKVTVVYYASQVYSVLTELPESQSENLTPKCTEHLVHKL